MKFEPGMTVICVDAKPSWPGQAMEIKEGEVYTIQRVRGEEPPLLVLDGVIPHYLAHRFAMTNAPVRRAA